MYEGCAAKILLKKMPLALKINAIQCCVKKVDRKITILESCVHRIVMGELI